MFVTRQSIGVSDLSDPAHIVRVACASTFDPVWELHGSIKTYRIGTRCLGIPHVEYTASSFSRQKLHRDLLRTEPDQVTADLSEHSRTQGDAEPQQRQDPVQRTRTQIPVSKDPNAVGFVPAFILGDIYVCQLPDKHGKFLHATVTGTEASNSSHRGLGPLPPSAAIALLSAIGSRGPAAGVMGLFASKTAAQQVAAQAYQQAQTAAQAAAEEAATSQLPVTKPAQSGNPVVRAIQWASDTVERRSQRVWKALQTDRHSGSDDADDDDADIKSGMLKVEAAMSQAERILGRLSDLAEKRIMKQMSVLPVPLAMGLDMAMTHPGRVCLVELLGKGKNKGQTPKAGKGQKGSGRDDTQVQHQIVPGIPTYTIPGITFGMPSSVGPLQFSPLFTSRRTAELTWEIAREALVIRYLHSRKVKRQLERNATEMGAARLTGLASRVETPEANEDDEGLGEPSEVAEFLNELGEGDNRPSKSNARFRPRGPLDFAGALACGAVSLFAKAVEWNGNTADDLLLHSPLGQRAIGMAGAPAIREQPLHHAILNVRDCNSVLQQWSGLCRIERAPQATMNAQSHSADTTSSAHHNGGEKHAASKPEASNAQASPSLGDSESSSEQHNRRFQPGQPQQESKADKSKSGTQSAAPTQAQSGSQSQQQPDVQPGTEGRVADKSRTHSQSQEAGSSQHQTQDQQQHSQQSQPQTQSQPHSQSQSQQPQPQPQPQQQESQPQQQQPQPQHQQRVTNHNKARLPILLPLMDDIRCVVGGGDELNMLDALQGIMAGLAVKVLTSQEGKLKSPFEIPIISLKGNPSEGLSSETLSTDSPKASINFDMSVATGKKKSVIQGSSGAELPPAQALLLVGDVGLDKYRNGAQYIKEQKGLRFGEGSVGFGNLSPVATIIEMQQRAAKKK